MSKTASKKNGNLNVSIHTTIARLRVPPEVSPETSLIVIAQLLCAAVHEWSLFSLLTFFFFLRKDGIQRKRLIRKDNKTKRERELYGLSYTAIVLDSPLVGKTITNYNRNAAYRCEPHILSTFFDMTPFCIWTFLIFTNIASKLNMDLNLANLTKIVNISLIINYISSPLISQYSRNIKEGLAWKTFRECCNYNTITLLWTIYDFFTFHIILMRSSHRIRCLKLAVSTWTHAVSTWMGSLYMDTGSLYLDSFFWPRNKLKKLI